MRLSMVVCTEAICSAVGATRSPVTGSTRAARYTRSLPPWRSSPNLRAQYRLVAASLEIADIDRPEAKCGPPPGPTAPR